MTSGHSGDASQPQPQSLEKAFVNTGHAAGGEQVFGSLLR